MGKLATDVAAAATALLPHASHTSEGNANAKDEMAAQTREQEKHFVAQFSEQQHPLPPEEIQQDPRNKELGGASTGLSVHDFELVRTLGTGACCPSVCGRLFLESFGWCVGLLYAC
jgi:hypothetical protein